MKAFARLHELATESFISVSIGSRSLEDPYRRNVFFSLTIGHLSLDPQICNGKSKPHESAVKRPERIGIAYNLRT